MKCLTKFNFFINSQESIKYSDESIKNGGGVIA